MDDRRQCPECRVDLKADDSACPFCGVALKKVPSSRAWGQRPALKPCPDCGGMVRTRAESCPQCGCPMRGKRRPKTGTLAIAMIGAFAVIVLYNMVMPDRRGAKAPLNPPRVAPGNRAVLDCKGGDGAYVAFDIEAWSQMAHA